MSTEHTEHTIARPRKRWLRACIFGLTFLVCGAIIGSSLTLYLVVDRFIDNIHNPEKLPGRITTKMRFGLGLDDEQAADIEETISRHQDELLAIRNEVYPRVQAQLELMKGDIEATLTPAQAEKFRKRFEALMCSLLPPPQQQ